MCKHLRIRYAPYDDTFKTDCGREYEASTHPDARPLIHLDRSGPRHCPWCGGIVDVDMNDAFIAHQLW